MNNKSDVVRLNLGCGKDVKPGWKNFDKYVEGEGIEYLDLEVFPWPFKSGSVDCVLLSHVLEHLVDQQRVLDEIRRICRPGAKVEIRLPVRCPILQHTSGFHGCNYLNFLDGKGWRVCRVVGGWTYGLRGWLGDKKEQLKDLFFSEYQYFLEVE